MLRVLLKRAAAKGTRTVARVPVRMMGGGGGDHHAPNLPPFARQQPPTGKVRTLAFLYMPHLILTKFSPLQLIGPRRVGVDLGRYRCSRDVH